MIKRAPFTIPAFYMGHGRVVQEWPLVIAVSPDAEPVCRWCYGVPMPMLAVCSRVSCIQNVAWLDSLEHATADDAKGWHGDRP